MVANENLNINPNKIILFETHQELNILVLDSIKNLIKHARVSLSRLIYGFDQGGR